MRRTSLPLLGLALGSLVLAGRCACTDPPPPPSIPHCEADLTPWVREGGSGARAVVAGAADLLAGEAATGRAGDFLLANDRIQVLLEQPGREIGPQPFGGNIIDADLVRPGEPARDRFGEMGPLFHFGRTVDVERMEVVRDGRAGGPAIVVATGRDTELDFVHLRGLLGRYIPGLLVPNADEDLHLRVSSWYVLNPGESAVHVVQAFCNDGAETVAFGVGDLVDTGGQVQTYSGRSGFAGALGVGDIADRLGENAGEPFVAWVGGDVAYGYFPPTDETQLLTVAGVTATLLDSPSILEWTNGPDAPPPAGARIVAPGASVLVARDFAVAADVGGLRDHYNALRGLPTGRVEGSVRRASGEPVAGARVVARRGEALLSLFTTGADGRFAGTVTPGALELLADDEVTRSAAASVTVAAGGTATTSLTLDTPGTLEVRITDAAGPLPGKVSVLCPTRCPSPRSSGDALLFRDAALDKLAVTAMGEVFTYAYVGAEGRVELPLPAGTYRVIVSRGPEYSRADELVTVATGARAALDARLAHVVDTTGWMSGDFHVHAINSPDSPIANADRLRSFLAEGVDVIVSTDHDFVTDFTPVLASLPGAGAFLKAITGVELTTFDYGHFNGFPLPVDPAKRNGGAVDWAGGRGPGMTPGDIQEALQAFPGEQVVQLNHAGGGLFGALGLDLRTLWSSIPGSEYRIRPVEADPATGDTRLFDPRFTAMEIQNGFSSGSMNVLLNAWFSFLSRGLRPTGTAVSDTHKRHGEAGSPRTWVRVGTDDTKTVDAHAYAHAVNEGAAFGSNGPFLLLKAGVDGASAAIGETLKTGSRTVTVELEARMPEWMDVTEASLFVNTPALLNGSGGGRDTLPPAQVVAPLRTELVERADGARFRRVVVRSDVVLERDAWIVALVTGPTDLFPVVGRGGVTPRAFTNPVFVDLDGDGWTPPVDLAAERARLGRVGAEPEPLRAAPTEAALRRALRAECHEDED
jgi:hypothetical protein